MKYLWIIFPTIHISPKSDIESRSYTHFTLAYKAGKHSDDILWQDVMPMMAYDQCRQPWVDFHPKWWHFMTSHHARDGLSPMSSTLTRKPRFHLFVMTIHDDLSPVCLLVSNVISYFSQKLRQILVRLFWSFSFTSPWLITLKKHIIFHSL